MDDMEIDLENIDIEREEEIDDLLERYGLGLGCFVGSLAMLAITVIGA